ncbi:MAG TPA: xanthine dehydrogenase family protein molybdopterin-binding subunit [Actinomycetota bacterium]|nr:xanthine dehydrogenase family protein molybdopterin-binding subunit [Actinomycetota bacterium]
MTERWVGQSLRRKEDERFVRGTGRYVADISFPGQLHAAFVRSPFAHARIQGIDASGALGIPGTVAVLTHADVPTGPMPPFLWDAPPDKLVAAVRPMLRPCHPPLLPADRVRFVGQAVAMVIAETRYAAEDAAERVSVGYEPLPPVPTVERALASDAPRVHEGWDDNVAVRLTVRSGDAQAALDGAHLLVHERFRIQRQAGLPLEARGAVGALDASTGRLTLWSATQNAHPLRRALSRVCGLDLDRVDVVAPDVGGGFGTKGVLYPEDLLVGLAALRLGRPVKWVEDRMEHMQSAIHAREQEHELRLGLAADGRILGLVDHFVVDTGAFNPLGLVIPYNTIAHLMGPYRVPAFEAVGTCVITTKAPTAPYRGAGRPEAVFAVERAIERAARALGMDPVELRERNLLRSDELPHDAGILYRDGEPLVLDSGDYPRALRRAVELVGYRAVPAERRAARASGRRLGVGVACYVEGTGIGPFEGAAVRLDPNGAVTVQTGACSQGQAHETVFAQVCADAMGVEPERVTVVTGDTRGLERGWGTVASRSAVVAGNAVRAAALTVRERLLRAAAEVLEVAEHDLVIGPGRVSVAGAPERAVELRTLAERDPEAFAATQYYEPPTVTWANGAHAAVVEVDPETGEVRVRRYAVVHDCGTVINPMVVDGQVHGGVAQGIGGALYEEVVYGEDAQLLSATLADYLIPTAAEVPTIRLEHLETPSPLNPLGVKGVGEGGAVPVAAAIANAVEDALGDLGVVVRETPLSPERVRSLFRA